LSSRDLMKKLQKCEIYANEPWTQFEVILSNEGKFKINFAYIPEKDSWPRVYMKRISDFSEKEWQETSIPKELWEERVRLKKPS
uniref:immunity protein YezG family protein n=1 Tax=Clostridium sp. TaxID=1506 RepID=UPI00260D6B63